MKSQESIYFLLPVRIRLKLESEAIKNGVTMSWIIRAVIKCYRTTSKEMPVYKRPGLPKEKHVRFSLKLYGDKNEILTYSRCNGGEFSPFIRHVLELWYEGELSLDLESEISVKIVKKTYFVFNGVASISLVYKTFYEINEFWVKNPIGNLYLMNLGLKCRKHHL